MSREKIGWVRHCSFSYLFCSSSLFLFLFLFFILFYFILFYYILFSSLLVFSFLSLNILLRLSQLLELFCVLCTSHKHVHTYIHRNVRTHLTGYQFRWDHDAAVFPGWILTQPWLTHDGMSARGILSVRWENRERSVIEDEVW